MVLKESAGALVLGGLLALAGLGFFVAYGFGAMAASRMSAHAAGRVVDASDEVTTSMHGKGGVSTTHTYFLKVLYTADAKLYDERFQVSKSAFETTKPGSDVEVSYDPREPRTADLAGGISARSGTSLIVRGAMLLVVGLLFVIVPARRARRKKALAAETT